ncbi:hypothetical protein BC826DRAFT_1185846 [Russula brevipes]|nr:hypothetical protein BC826DRAFT_1185846 [Russula brevipes]
MSTLEGTNIGKGAAPEFWVKGSRDRPYRRTRFESLPDDVLLFIFSFYLDQAQDEERLPGERAEEWHALVHVCRRWRCVVFASPRRLRLRLVCTERRSVEEMNNIWPALPIVIRAVSCYPPNNPKLWEEYTHNIITALQLNDRVSEISFGGVACWIFESFVAVMKEPFPFLTSLMISSSRGNQLTLPNFFLGGSSPRLRSLHLDYVRFPALWTLLSSTSDLRKLFLRLISSIEYISPDAMVSCLSATTRLRSLHLDFDFGLGPPRSDREGPTRTRIALPALTHFSWKGASGYLNDLLTWIDAPQLYSMKMTFGRQAMRSAPQIALFIGRTERFKEPYRANLNNLRRSTELLFPLRTQTVHYPSPKLVVDCGGYAYFPAFWPLSYLAFPLSTVERLDVDGICASWQSAKEKIDWLKAFDVFVAVKDLCVSEGVALHVVQALQELSVERATEVLPALHSLFIEGLGPSGPVREAVEQFVATRQLSGHPVAVRPWTGSKVWTENLIAVDDNTSSASSII